MRVYNWMDCSTRKVASCVMPAVLSAYSIVSEYTCEHPNYTHFVHGIRLYHTRTHEMEQKGILRQSEKQCWWNTNWLPIDIWATSAVFVSLQECVYSSLLSLELALLFSQQRKWKVNAEFSVRRKAFIFHQPRHLHHHHHHRWQWVLHFYHLRCWK